MLSVVTSELVPSFLVAVPQLRDPNFRHAVVLMLEHGESGALGLVINREAGVNLAEVARLQSLPERPELEQGAVYIGGPVQPERGFVLHDNAEVEESVPVLDGVRVSASMESLTELLAGPVDRFRLVLGFSGWGPGQLEKELQEGSWLITKADPRHVLETPAEEIWAAVLADMGIDPGSLVMGGGLH